MNTADDAARTLAHAQREANRHTRLQPYDPAHDAWDQALRLDAPLAERRHWRRDT